MLFLDVLPEVKDYISSVNSELSEMPGNKPKMTRKAMNFLSVVLTAIIVTGALNWEKFQRASAGTFKATALSWMLHRCKFIPWKYLIIASTKHIIKVFNLKNCHLVFDDFDRNRSKRTTEIFGVHKVRNKKGGGFVNAQNIVILSLVSNYITIPLFFWFYVPDPEQKAWRKEDKRLRKLKIPKSKRPKQPPLNPDYPDKKQIAVKLLRKTRYYFPNLNILSISGDALYLSKQMKVEVARVYPETQFISQIRRNQSVYIPRQQKPVNVEKYFTRITGQTKIFKIRGHLEKIIHFKSARVYVKSHNKVSHIIAYKYDGEEKYRYICASDLTWCAESVIQAFAYRWLVEVVIEDLKLFDGWGLDASQYGFEGASRGLRLSLLLDQFLTQHPKQRNLHRSGKSLYTAGSLKSHLQMESLLQTIRGVLECDDPKAKLRDITEKIDNVIVLRKSSKHMSGQEFAEVGPSPSLLAKFGRRKLA